MSVLNVHVQMSDAVATFYSGPSGQQAGGGKGMSQVGRYAIPLWKNVKNKICDVIPSGSKLCGKQTSKVAQDVRSLGERQLEEGPRLPATPQVKKRKQLKPKKKKRVKKVRFTSDDEEAEDEYYRRPRHKRPKSRISRVLGSDTY